MLASALSMMIFCLSGSPLRPDSIENGRIDAVDFFVVAQIGLYFDLRAVLDPLRQICESPGKHQDRDKQK